MSDSSANSVAPSGEAVDPGVVDISTDPVVSTDADAAEVEPNEISYVGLTEGQVWDYIYEGTNLQGKSRSEVRSADFAQYIVSDSVIAGTQPPRNAADFSSASSFASFGDNGTTASVNSHGQIVQITKFLDAGRSGFFCVDRWTTPAPYHVKDRAKVLAENCSDYRYGIGFRLKGFENPKLDFISDRWPRFTCEVDGYIFRMQYFVCDGTIFQQYILESCPSQEPVVHSKGSVEKSKALDSHEWLSSPFAMDSDLLIRDLDWQNEGYPFNEAIHSDDSYSTDLRNNGFSLVRSHKSPSSVSGSTTNVGLEAQTNADVHDQGSETGSETQVNGNGTQISVELVVTAFLNGKPCRLKRDPEDDPRYEIDIPKGTAKTEFSSVGRLEITVAYQLQLMTSHPCNLVPAWKLKDMRDAFARKTFQDVRFSTKDELDWVVRRNLEHILSVCSIPVLANDRDGHGSEENGSRTDSNNDIGKIQVHEMEDDGYRIALTCGDMSGHRLLNSASVFAFLFLTAIHRFIQDKLNTLDKKRHRKPIPSLALNGAPMEEKQDLHDSSSAWEEGNITYVQLHELASRIRQVCRGHIAWVFKSAVISSTKGAFGSNYWASGRRIENLDDLKLRYSSPDSLTDAAFQFIKAAEFKSMSALDSAEEDLPEDLIRIMIGSWVAELKEADKRPDRGPYAFARSTDEITKSENYYLEDHAWIWKALKSIEALGLNDDKSIDLEEKKKKEESSDELKRTEQSERKFSSKEAQRQVLKRFTTEYPTSKRRMLAVYRSSSESRFMLRSRDTALFHCMDSRFFSMTESSSLVDVWRSTLAAQINHEENQTNGWKNPLRYALALTMACKGFQINRGSTDETINEAKAVLFRSSWANGLFPGFLNYATKDPEIFSHEDYRQDYWHVSFEVPFVLWKHCKEILETSSEGFVHQTTHQRTSTASNAVEEKQRAWFASLTQEVKTTREVVITTKNIPFNNLIDQESIVEPQDEWLYSEPEFLTFAPDQGKHSLWSDLKDALSSGGSVLDDGPKGIIVDVRRSSDKSTKNGGLRNTCKEKFPILRNDDILQKLRTREKSSEGGVVKKRLIWLPCGDMVTAEACSQSVPTLERESLEVFFERHATYDNFFFDDTTATSNTWKTELHLAFYQLHEIVDARPHSSIPEQRQIPFPCTQSKRDSLSISRATMGFRFDGDFFDRYWTCHFVEYKPGKGNEMFKVDTEELRRLLEPDGLPEIEKGKQPWRQRKILELILFDKILDEITSSTKRIMNEIRAELEDIRAHAVGTSKSVPGATREGKSGEFGSLANPKSLLHSKISSKRGEAMQKADALEDADSATRFISVMKGEDYLEFSKQSQALEQVLRVLDDDLGENMEHIERWKKRETDRAPEKPRWTRNDERRYRTTITKMLVSNNKRIRALQRCRANVQSLRTSLESTREYIRDDLSLRGAEDIRIFTYVTATFLPISFATSVFSMGGFPGGVLLGSMIGLAVIALSLTGIALVYDKKLASYASAIKDIFPHSRNKHENGENRSTLKKKSRVFKRT